MKNDKVTVIIEKYVCYSEIYTIKRINVLSETKQLNYSKLFCHNENRRVALQIIYTSKMSRHASILFNENADILCYAENYSKYDILEACENFVSDILCDFEKLISLTVFTYETNYENNLIDYEAEEAKTETLNFKLLCDEIF